MATEENKTDTAPITNKSDAGISLPPQEKSKPSAASDAVETKTANIQTLEASAVSSRKTDSSVELQIGGAEENLLTGLKVCPGVAWGLTLQLTSSDLEIHQFAIDKSAVRGEIQRLRMATASANKQLEQLAETLDEDAPAEASAFLDVYQTILQDPSLITETADIIRENSSTPSGHYHCVSNRSDAILSKLTMIISETVLKTFPAYFNVFNVCSPGDALQQAC